MNHAHTVTAGRGFPRPLMAVMLLLALLPAASGEAVAQPAGTEAMAATGGPQFAPVVVDGRTLFFLRGITSYPAEQRAADVRDRIIAAARDAAVTPEQITLAETPQGTEIRAGATRLFVVFDVDSEIEGLDRTLLAQAYRTRIAQALTEFRIERSPETLLRNSGYALAATLIAALVLWIVLRFFRWLDRWMGGHVQQRLESLADKAHQFIRAQQAWALVTGFLRLIRILAVLLIVYFFLNTVLGLYPWTRPAAGLLLHLVVDPLASIGKGFIGAIPNLAFLVILWLVVRAILKAIKAFFLGIGDGRIRLEKFDPDWAMPTYKIVRFLVIAFALVIAYPYIPGSDSLAFKGISVFLGVLLSLGSSSFISNMIAGLAMTYRGAFKEGDLVQIGDATGRVEDIKLMTTRIRTVKNESVVIPNSNILNTNVVNLSFHARERGLILHTTVGIGYETPWRQVEAMLIEAATRTDGLKQEPSPFVLQRALGDFAVTYEINAFFDDPSRRLVLLNALHANILDVFNEYGIQIMTPAYEGDPEVPKVVPQDQWYTAPARPPEAT